ncbi:putative DNA-binding protein [Actinoplanes missouriensis 431]|uniref:Putative DNA-binding protein n=1 Tax=Actinoplanes missouriensis (strain ATCC 14538 / DSM 43046 / CBS 188.64 / JCM 3121 / NBRC 102363 / NCIMB 12654 / NRRL B-3342 / UNCC 431) TaxID=512565 RepID=I0HBU1_ACTM4|nr:helix-turn-helix domain-containing protein [Actinoplanes missouriensis]BAL90478.1 putative DNA-binding protein [Actinoplanes missouriensis 431]
MTASSSAEPSVDLVTLGQRLRHLRRSKGLTLDQLSDAVGRAPSQLSLIENGKREPKLSVLQAIAGALGVPLQDLLRPEAPSRRAGLEIELAHFQQNPAYQALGLPVVRAGRRLPADALEALIGMHRELNRVLTEQSATPEVARRANAQLRAEMRKRNNYFAEIEQAAANVLRSVRHTTGPLSQRGILDIAAQIGFTLHYVNDLPSSTRSVTDLKNRRIFLPQVASGKGHDPRAVVLQTLGHFVLGHNDPADYGDFLRQRVEVNYFAAALLMPEKFAAEFLSAAKADKALAIDDFRDAFGVSYETAAHRFTNLATHHFGIPVHFARVHESGIVYKAYENDNVRFPSDVTGAIEGQPVCRKWASRTVFEADDPYSSFYQFTDTTAGTYWCTVHVESTSAGLFSVTVGTPYEHARWFRGGDVTGRTVSNCPDPDCCRRPPAELVDRWAGNAWPSARVHSHLLAALPPGTFPGVDNRDVYDFLERRA